MHRTTKTAARGILGGERHKRAHGRGGEMAGDYCKHDYLAAGCDLCEIERLTTALAESNRLVKHWRDQHANEVARARVLKDRLDMPLERTRAYCHMGELQAKLDKMTAKIDSDNTIMGELRRGGCAFVELPAYWRGVESEVDKLKGELAAEREKERATEKERRYWYDLCGKANIRALEAEAALTALQSGQREE